MIPIEDHIRANRRKTWFLFGGMFLILAVLVVVIMEVMGGGLFWVGFAAVLGIVLFLVMYFQGHNIIARMAGAREITEEDEPYLWHTVEGLSIAAGTSMPKPYIIETETPNAFAAGRSPKHSIVAVTRGLIDKLDRTELEAVLAHEMAHIKNYDIRVATFSVVLAGVISVLSLMLRRYFIFGGVRRRGGGNSRGGGKAGAILMVIALLVGIIAPIFAKVVQFAISREREYLADASGAELNGYPEALASALEKISGMNDGEDEKLSDNDMLQGLYIVNPLKTNAREESGQIKMFTTHPDVKDRVDRLREM